MTLEIKSLPMKEAMAFWRDKVPLPPRQYNVLPDEAKLRAFAVAGIAKGDELATVMGALQKAVGEGISFGQFKAECKEIFEKRGWTGKRAWRVDNIFRTNIQTAFNVGRYKQMKVAVATRPFWMYNAVNDRRTRPTHRGLHGKVFPADHQFWDTWWPPNGFRCRCGVTSLSARQLKKRGLKVESDIPTMIMPIDPTTGNKLPPVQLLPATGFAHNPGKSAWGGLAPREGVSGFEDIGLKSYGDYRRRKLDNLPAKHYRPFSEDDLLPLKKKPEFYLSFFLKEFGFKGDGGVFTDKLGDSLIISRDLFTTAAGKLKVAKRGREKHIKLLARTIQDPYEVWLVPQRDKVSGQVVLRKRYIRGFSTGPDNKLAGFVAFDYGKDGWEGVTAFAPDKLSYADKVRNGVMLYGEK